MLAIADGWSEDSVPSLASAIVPNSWQLLHPKFVILEHDRLSLRTDSRCSVQGVAVPSSTPAAFVSYSREDSAFALRLAGELKAAGIFVWLDQLAIVAGQRWDRAVERALEDSPVVLVVISCAAIESTNVMDEVNFALEKKKTLIPVLVQDCAIPFRLRRIQYVDFRGDYSRALNALVKYMQVCAGEGMEHVPAHESGETARVQMEPSAHDSLEGRVLRCWNRVVGTLWGLSDSGGLPVSAAERGARRLRNVLLWAAGVVAILIAAAVIYFVIASPSSSAPLRIAAYTQITHDGHAGVVAGTDGSRLYLGRGFMRPIGQVALSGGEVEPVQIPITLAVLDDISPDGSTFLVESYEQGQSQTRPLYAVPVLEGSRQYLANVTGAAWAPDGKSVGYTTPNGDIYLIRSDGSEPHKLISLGGTIDREVGKGEGRSLAWSPDGSRISLTKDNLLWEMSSSGTNLHRILPDGQLPHTQCCGSWSPDGKIFVFLSGTGEIWAIDEQRGLFQRSSPVLLASGPIRWGDPQFSKDSKTIFANGWTDRGELARLDKKSNQFQLFLAGISADRVCFSRDGQAVAYVSYPDGILWRANKDGSERVQLTDRALTPQWVSWSPDASEIAFMAPSGGQTKAYIVSSQGGSPRPILPNVDESETDPNWSPDGSKIVFSTGRTLLKDSTIRILDLTSHQVTTLPGSEGKFSAHWSPDGRFLDALSDDSSKLYLFDTKTQHWSTLYENQGAFAYPIWTRDSHFIYFIRPANGGAVLRIPVTGGNSQLVIDLKDFRYAGKFGLWLGLDPTDAPLLLRDLGTNDVYALSLEQK